MLLKMSLQFINATLHTRHQLEQQQAYRAPQTPRGGNYAATMSARGPAPAPHLVYAQPPPQVARVPVQGYAQQQFVQMVPGYPQNYANRRSLPVPFSKLETSILNFQQHFDTFGIDVQIFTL